MLTIILRILSVIGIVLLVLLAVILAILLLMLFMPITYRVSASRKPEGEPPAVQTRLTAKIGWLFGLIRIRFAYPEPGEVIVKFLFFTVFSTALKKPEDDAKEEPDPDEEPERKGKRQKRKKQERPRKEREMPESVPQTDNLSKPDVKPLPETDVEEPVYPEPDPQRDQRDQPKANPIQKISFKVRDICDKIKNIKESADYYRELLLCDDTRKLISHAFMRIGKILKSICPRKLKAIARFGTGSPDTTGYILGVYSMLSPKLGKQIRLTPDFDEAVLEGEFYAAGHITICKLLWHAIRLLLDKRFRGLMRKLKKKEDK